MSGSHSPALDWDRYRQLKAEGRLNILLRLSEPTAMRVSGIPTVVPPDRPNVLPFVSRAEHLAWRRNWTHGRFVKFGWSPEEREGLLRQDALFREADARWAERHGPVDGGARVLTLPDSTEGESAISGSRA